MLKRALVSVSDKTGLVDLLKPLVREGLKVVSTGGTAKFLEEAGIKCESVSDQTQFPEVMGGRVKTLHPKIHMALLARPIPEDEEVLRKFEIQRFDLVICNLYPFEKTRQIEQIDVGGPSMLRAAAKNFEVTAVLCDPSDYPDFLKVKKEGITIEQRRKWAAKVFAHTAHYDAMIAQTLGGGEPLENTSDFKLLGSVVSHLRYGENPHQNATWYANANVDLGSWGIHRAEILQGKELSYNNLLDLDAAVSLARRFQQPAAVAVKHNNPCGVACAKSLYEALVAAVQADPVSVFGGIIVLNGELTQEMVEFLDPHFLECILVPRASLEAKELLKKKPNRRVLLWPEMSEVKTLPDIRSVLGGFLYQNFDEGFGRVENWDFGGIKVPEVILQDMIFGEKVCGALKSNAIALVKDQITIGLGMGQVNRIDAVEQALERWQKHHSQVKEPVLVSDAFFPFPDAVEKAHQFGVRWILQPGGSMRDKEVKARAEQLEIHIVWTGRRHFRH